MAPATGRTTRITTITDMTADLLRLSQWLSPAFPISSYAYSHGLETAMATGRVRDAAGVQIWVGAVLRFGAGALDVWAIRAVMAGGDSAEVADTLRARAGCSERWRETRDQGRAFCDVTTGMGEPPLVDLPLPVALAERARGMNAATVAALYLQAFAGQLVAAATRFVPLGQTEAQTVLHALHPLCLDLAAQEDAAPPGAGALLAEVDAMTHETLQPRLFRT